jgi:hypothetical protein
MKGCQLEKFTMTCLISETTETGQVLAGTFVLENGKVKSAPEEGYEVLMQSHCCPAKVSGSHSNPLKTSMITHGRSRNDLN